MQDAITIPHLIALQTQLMLRLGEKFGDRSLSAPFGRGQRPLPPGFMEARAAQDLDLERLPYALSSAFDAIVRLVEHQATLLRDEAGVFADVRPGVIRVLDDRCRNPMAFAVDAYFDAAGRAQNAVAAYVNCALNPKHRLPASLHQVGNKIENGDAGLPPPIANMLRTYWLREGRRIKANRDLAQHHTVVSSEGWVRRVPSGHLEIHLVVPNNPEEKSPKALLYRDPTIHACLFAVDSFLHLYRFVYELTYRLVQLTGTPEVVSFSMRFKSGIGIPSPNDAHAASDVPTLIGEVRTLRQELDKRFAADSAAHS
jgi:hypothetical protein